jgi:hypothetical protein
LGSSVGSGYGEEKDFKTERSCDALEDLAEEKQFDYLDMTSTDVY